MSTARAEAARIVAEAEVQARRAGTEATAADREAAALEDRARCLGAR